MGLIKKGKNWYIDYRYPPGRQGKRIRERIGPDKDEAMIVLSTRLKDMRVGRNPELRRITPRPFEAVVKEFEEKHVALCRNPKSYLDSFSVDSLVHDEPAFRGLLEVFGSERIALGTDYPFPLGEERPGQLIESLSDLPEEVVERLFSGTALEFLGVDRETLEPGAAP